MSDGKPDFGAEKHPPVVSVLIAAYNCEAFVQEAIASIQRQTLSEIEIVVVNDGSTDKTSEIIRTLAAHDSRIRFIDMPENGGCVKAWRTGLEHCSAPYIARMDADDVAIEDRLAKQVSYLNRHPEIALIGGAAISIDENGRKIDLAGFSPIPITEPAIQRSLHLATPCYHPAWLVRRELYSALKGYRETTPSEDYDFILRAVSAGYRVGNIPDVIMMLRIRRGQASSVSSLKQRKMHNYVVSLYQQRMRGRPDGYTPELAKAAVQSGKLSNSVHRLAGRWVSKAFQCRNRGMRVLLLGAAALISPWQAKYFMDRLRFRMVCRGAVDRDKSA